MQKNDTIISLLQEEMTKSGYISKDSIIRISKTINKPESEIYGVATFYSQFSLTPKAKHIIDICIGTACFVLGGDKIMLAIENKLGIHQGQTTSDGRFKLNGARCLGCCGLAPAVSIDGQVYGKMTPQKIVELIDKINSEDANE